MLSKLTALTSLHITVRHVPDMLHFGSLPATLFRACSRLQTLALNNCGVRAAPLEVAYASRLKQLQLLSTKPPEGAPLPCIELPPHVSKLRLLAELQLSSSVVPPSFVSHLTNLSHLTLDQVHANANVQSRSGNTCAPLQMTMQCMCEAAHHCNQMQMPLRKLVNDAPGCVACRAETRGWPASASAAGNAKLGIFAAVQHEADGGSHGCWAWQRHCTRLHPSSVPGWQQAHLRSIAACAVLVPAGCAGHPGPPLQQAVTPTKGR